MSTIDELKKVRLRKLKDIKDIGILPYPSKTKRTHTISEALDNFTKFLKGKKRIVLVGRIRALRGHGGATFLDIEDGTGKIQGLVKEDKVGAKGYKFFVYAFEIGDFVEIEGTLFTTKRGEKTIEADDYKILSKSLLPLPEKWHGLQDEEEKLRKRYLDILFNPELKEMIKKRAVFWNSMRQFLMEKDFLEVETPVLETTTGGADAKPFTTHHNALDMDVFLRISTGELWQKKLMVAGFEKTFEIGRQFRNEGMDAEHLQDYTQMEFYWAYADYEKGMELVEGLYKFVIKKTFGTLKFKIRGFDVDFGKKWEKYDYQTIINKYTKINVFEATLQVILAGSENGKGYSELNDPLDQTERFTEQQKLREKGDEEAQMFDKDFVEALEYGMPPTCGFGLSERLFSFLMDKPARETQIFPLMKPKERS